MLWRFGVKKTLARVFSKPWRQAENRTLWTTIGKRALLGQDLLWFNKSTSGKRQGTVSRGK